MCFFLYFYKITSRYALKSIKHIKLKISMRNSHQNRFTLYKDFIDNHVEMMNEIGAWFMKYWATLIRPFSTENWAAWLRQFLPHFLSLTRKFLTLYITSSFLWKYFLQKNVIYKKVEMLYIVNVFKSSLKLLAIWIWICEIKRVIKWAFYFSNWNY